MIQDRYKCGGDSQKVSIPTRGQMKPTKVLIDDQPVSFEIEKNTVLVGPVKKDQMIALQYEQLCPAEKPEGNSP